MNKKSKLYIILYYLLYILMLIFILGSMIMTSLKAALTPTITYITNPSLFLFFIATLFFIIFNIFFIKIKNIDASNRDIMLELLFIIFILIMVICCLIFDTKLIIPTYEYSYYTTLVLFPFLIININSMFLIKKVKK